MFVMQVLTLVGAGLKVEQQDLRLLLFMILILRLSKIAYKHHIYFQAMDAKRNIM